MAGWRPLMLRDTLDETPPLDEDLLPGGGGEGDGELDEGADRADLAAYRRSRRHARLRRLGTGAAGLIGLAVVWQIAATFIRDPVFLPSVTQTVSTFLHYLDRPYPSQGSPLW